MISEVANARHTDTYELKDKFIQSKIAKEIYNCQHKTFINRTIRGELKIMQHILSHPGQHSLETPKAHLITGNLNLLYLVMFVYKQEVAFKKINFGGKLNGLNK